MNSLVAFKLFTVCALGLVAGVTIFAIVAI